MRLNNEGARARRVVRKRVPTVANNDDTVEMEMRIPKTKIAEVKDIVAKWQGKMECRQTELKSLLGRLFFLATCSKTLPLFSNRLLACLRGSGKRDKVILDVEAKKDLALDQ